MLSINKCFICFNFKDFLTIRRIKLNTISSKLEKRFFSSTKIENKLNRFRSCSQTTNQLIRNKILFRCLSSNVEPKCPPKSTTTSSAEVRAEEPVQRRVVQPIGIVGIDKTEETKNVEEWTPVYCFPYILQIRTLQRLKLWMTVMCCISVPTQGICFSLGYSSLDTLQIYSAICMLSLFGLYFVGLMFRRFVGRVYISRNESVVRLSHLSFFGNRIDADVEAIDVVPLKDSNDRLNDWFCRIERYSCDDLLFMSLKFGGISDRKGFDKVFGEDATKWSTNR